MADGQRGKPVSSRVRQRRPWWLRVLLGSWLARRLRLSHDMSNTNSQVIVGYDFSHSGAAALSRAIALAARAPFHVLHVACIVDRHAQLPGHEHHGRVDFAYTERVQQAVIDV